jgi:hypothetical protein
MFEEKDRTIFDSTDVPLVVDQKSEDGLSPAETTGQNQAERPPAKSFVDWIARGYLPG